MFTLCSLWCLRANKTWIPTEARGGGVSHLPLWFYWVFPNPTETHSLDSELLIWGRNLSKFIFHQHVHSSDSWSCSPLTHGSSHPTPPQPSPACPNWSAFIHMGIEMETRPSRTSVFQIWSELSVFELQETSRGLFVCLFFFVRCTGMHCYNLVFVFCIL